MSESAQEKDPETTPGRGTFSFDDFVFSKAKSPVIRHTVYLDAEAGHRRADLEDQINALESELGRMRTKVEKNSFMSLVEKGDMTEKMHGLETRLAHLRDEFDKATADVLASAIVFNFRWENMDKPKEVINQAYKKWCEREGVTPTGLDKIGSTLRTEQQNDWAAYSSCALVCAGTEKVEYPNGSSQDGPLQMAQIEKLALSVLLPFEREKLFEAVAKSFGAADDWFSGIDAGFPG